ncbi:MAG: cobalamin B12-binding domain-containing protein [Actinomycetota bacterium]|nr:cobalamin B12-binding domain-containing protein [Actinomycetota bacterium]
MFVQSLYIQSMPAGGDPGHLRIGELSRRVGVSPELLRAWERRYGLLSPSRTSGGFRLYGEDDERRIRRMLEYRQEGVSAAQAARLARAEQTEALREDGVHAPVPAALRDDLRRALDDFDDAGSHAALDRLLGAFPLETVLHDAVLPYLHELGERWQRGEASVAQEHFASALLRSRLLGLARGWGTGRGPRALLACLPGDQHDLGLICFGLALRGHGWRITFLGADTPLFTITEAAHLLQPALVVVTVTLAEQATDARAGLLDVAGAAPIAIAGGGASSTIAHTIGARYLREDPVTAAATVAGATGTPEHPEA